MQRKECFFTELVQIKLTGWEPAPREYATLTANGNALFLIGGLNYEANKELARLTMSQGGACSQLPVFSEWKNIKFECEEKLVGR